MKSLDWGPEFERRQGQGAKPSMSTKRSNSELKLLSEAVLKGMALIETSCWLCSWAGVERIG